MDGHKHAPFFDVKAYKIIIQVQLNQKIGWHTRYDLDLEENSYFCDLETFDLSYGSVQEGNLQKVMVGHETNFLYFTLQMYCK